MKTKQKLLSVLTVMCMVFVMLPISTTAFNPDMYKANIKKISIGAPLTDLDGRKYLPVDVEITATEDLGDGDAVYFLEGYLKTQIQGGMVEGITGLGMTLMRVRGYPINSNEYCWEWSEGQGTGTLKYNVPLLADGEEQTAKESQATGLVEVNALQTGDQITFQQETILKNVPDEFSVVKSDPVTVTIEELNNYPKTITVGEEGDKTAVAPEGKTLTYNRTAQTGVDAGTGYTLSGTYQATDADDYTAIATLADGYKWSDGTTAPKNISWKIQPATLTMLTWAMDTKIYDGTEKEASNAIVLGQPVSPTEDDYGINYLGDRVNAGDCAVQVVGKGNFTGTLDGSFTIFPDEIFDLELSSPSFFANGEVQVPTVTSVLAYNSTPTANDYTVEYSNDKSTEPGEYTVTVTAKGINYTGSATGTYKIEENPLGKVGVKYQTKANAADSITDVRFVLVAEEKDVINEKSASFYATVPTEGDTQAIEITRAYRSLIAGGKKMTAPEGKVLLIAKFNSVPDDLVEGMSGHFTLGENTFDRTIES